ncbi:hypothetical protein PEPS_11130 [Persicobacter psychrovividus]|uniref:Uncharacterized protein n=1 Tax=Persicobacter psychrovividus TaxID=387638 RepID=A0ABN6L6Q0_9BACT|nr:hypothetical protein PEPS_11130 [Persicobacter psychrovividus]
MRIRTCIIFLLLPFFATAQLSQNEMGGNVDSLGCSTEPTTSRVGGGAFGILRLRGGNI